MKNPKNVKTKYVTQDADEWVQLNAPLERISGVFILCTTFGLAYRKPQSMLSSSSARPAAIESGAKCMPREKRNDRMLKESFVFYVLKSTELISLVFISLIHRTSLNPLLHKLPR